MYCVGMKVQSDKGDCIVEIANLPRDIAANNLSLSQQKNHVSGYDNIRKHLDAKSGNYRPLSPECEIDDQNSCNDQLEWVGFTLSECIIAIHVDVVILEFLSAKSV